MTKFKVGSNQYQKIPVYSGEKLIKKISLYNDSRFTRFLNFVGIKKAVRDEFKRIIKVVFKLIAIQSVAAAVILATFYYGSHSTSAQVIYTPVSTQVMPSEISAFPILQKIADCESGIILKNGKAKSNTATQYAPNGQVITRPNANSVDIGIMQINLKVWGAQATKLNYDLSTKEGNEEMGLWIYENRGTSDWYSSQSCWQ